MEYRKLRDLAKIVNLKFEWTSYFFLLVYISYTTNEFFYLPLLVSTWFLNFVFHLFFLIIIISFYNLPYLIKKKMKNKCYCRNIENKQ